VSRKRQPLVQLTPACWRVIAAEAAGAHREFGGLLLGTRTRQGNFRVHLHVALAHEEATSNKVLYDVAEETHARAMADEVYGPRWQVVGAWHVHPYETCCRGALLPQISDDWDDEESDVNAMYLGEVELIVSAFQAPEYTRRVLQANEYTLQRLVADRVCRGEAWYRVRGRRKVIPCRVKVRSM
jgi:hypothetical protein